MISRRGFREPRDNKDLFTVLYENGVIGEETCRSMVKMAKFRNIVVHDYARIDPGIVAGILKNNLNDVKRFGKEVLEYMDTEIS